MKGLESVKRTANRLLGREHKRTELPSTPEGRRKLADEIGEEGVELLQAMYVVRIELLNGETTTEEALKDLGPVVSMLQERTDE